MRLLRNKIIMRLLPFFYGRDLAKKSKKKLKWGFPVFILLVSFLKKAGFSESNWGRKKIENNARLSFIIYCKMSEIKQVTARQCCTAMCDNTEQLLNIGCGACIDKPFSKKHYLCMECYITLLTIAKKEKRDPVCPLDRTPIKVDYRLDRMIDVDLIMDSFWTTVHRTYSGIMNLERFTARESLQYGNVFTERRRDFEFQTIPEWYGFNRTHEVVTSSVREETPMQPLREFTPARQSFPFPDINTTENNEENIPPSSPNTVTVGGLAFQEMLVRVDASGNLEIVDQDDEAANGFHDPNNNDR